MRKLAETEKQWQLGQIRGAQIVEKAKQEELRVAKEQEQQKTESVEQVKEIKHQDIFGEANEPKDQIFPHLPLAKKAALHWAVAQEYWSWHDLNMNYKKAETLAEIHGKTVETVLRKSYEKWRDQTIHKHLIDQGLINAVYALDQAQKDEQLNPSPNRHGCEWMSGKCYIDRNPSPLCTPVIGACVEGDCNNGHGTYVSFDGSRFVGEFRRGAAFRSDSIYGPSKCLQGNCTNGHGTYVFLDSSKYVGDFKNGKPNGQGTKTWAIGFSYTGEFKSGLATGKGKYTWPAKRNLSQATCLEGDCNNGKGVMMYANDTKYVGYFKSGEPHGRGIYHWRTGEALDGDFAEGWLKPGGNHISPEGIVLVQTQKRTWNKTYQEEEDAAKDAAQDNPTKAVGNFILRETIRGLACEQLFRMPGMPPLPGCSY
ncbi:MAG: hypothetical protein E8D40_00915 [Nitrospira sp.]|nr:MAG: hypothetical protein E8D40_00915 [Nitrospira sp.]